MNLRTIILLLLFTFPVMVKMEGQSLIGLDKQQVLDLVKKDHNDFSQDKSIVKQQFNYLKFVNHSQTITWIVYFSDDDLCTSTKKVCDYIEYDFVLDDLNEDCDQTGDLQWQCQEGDRTFTLTLEEKDWYFTLREREVMNKK